MAIESTEKTAVYEIAPGIYRVVEVGGRSVASGRFVTAAQAARRPRNTSDGASTETPADSAARRRTTTRAAANGPLVTKFTSAKSSE